MKVFIVLMTFMLTGFSTSQTLNWKVFLGKKQVIASTKEDAKKNKITVRRADLQKKGSLTVLCSENRPQSGWKREIVLVDQDENEIARAEGRRLVTDLALLSRHLSKGARSYHIYTWTLPTDPEKAALIRVRRVHLCTIIVK